MTAQDTRCSAKKLRGETFVYALKTVKGEYVSGIIGLLAIDDKPVRVLITYPTFERAKQASEVRLSVLGEYTTVVEVVEGPLPGIQHELVEVGEE